MRSQTVDAYPTAIQPPARLLDRWLATRLQQVIAPAAVRLELWDGSSPYSRDDSAIGSILVHDRTALLGLILDPDQAGRATGFNMNDPALQLLEIYMNPTSCFPDYEIKPN